jgi:hypothetical protein
MGALHLAVVHQTPFPPRRRRGGGRRGGGGRRFLIPSGSCEPCRDHWHHRCRGVDVLDEHRPDCRCPCGDPRDPTGLRLSAAAWTDLAQHVPQQVWVAVQLQSLREGGGVFVCAWRSDDNGLRSALR